MNDKIKSVLIIIVIFALMAGPEMLFSIIDSGVFEDISLNPNDYTRITDMDYTAVVVDEPGCAGKVVVTERITFDVHAASRYNPFWELWRDLPEEWIDGEHLGYQVNSVKQILPNGQEVEWEESPQLYWDDYDYVSSNSKLGPEKWFHSPGPYNEYNEQYECVFFYVDGVYREQMVFEIEYELSNAVMRYGDCSSLYLPMYADNLKYLDSFTGQVLIPKEKMPSAGNYELLTLGTNNAGFPVTESDSMNPGYYTFFFDLNQSNLKCESYSDYLEFQLVSYGNDKHAFSEYASKNRYYNDDALEEIYDEYNYYKNEPAKYRLIKTAICIGCLVLAVIIALFNVNRLRKLKERHNIFLSEDQNSTYRDIPSDLDPKFAAALVACKEKKKENDADVYSSILLSLARKKYIRLDSYGTSDVQIVIEGEKKEDPITTSFGDATFQQSPFRSTEFGNPTFNNPTFAPTQSEDHDTNFNRAQDPLYPQYKPYSEGQPSATLEEPYNPFKYSKTFMSYKDPELETPQINQQDIDDSSSNSEIDTLQMPSDVERHINEPLLDDMCDVESKDNADNTHQKDYSPAFSFSEFKQDENRYGVSNDGFNDTIQSETSVFGVEPQANFGDFEFAAQDVGVQEELIDPREPLTKSEVHYLNLIRRHAVMGSISMNVLQSRISTDYDYTRDFVNNVEKVVVDYGIGLSYFQKANHLELKQKLALTAKTLTGWGIAFMIANLLSLTTPLGFLYGGPILLGLACIAVGIYIKSQSHKFVLLTTTGEQEYRKWRGLYNFLKSDTLINERTVVELPLWEKYLVYATAFGISDKVTAAIKIRCSDVLTTDSIVTHPYCRSGRFRSSGVRFHSSVRTGYNRSHHSSYGGYGYGGRGGGSGGGGH